jgi:O-acetyl-ADP-ribose deacetylase (regulator of RNase III)
MALLYNLCMSVVRQQYLATGQQLSLIHDDLTLARVDAIVNAANRQLQHGGGVASAIARRGGPTIQIESDEWIRSNGPIAHNSPALTGAGELPCKHVIHVVGPVWGEGDEDSKLFGAVQAALNMATQLNLESLALPAVSTGIFGFPKDRGARIIVDAIEGFFQNDGAHTIKQVKIVLIDQPSIDIFANEFDNRWGPKP